MMLYNLFGKSFEPVVKRFLFKVIFMECIALQHNKNLKICLH